MSRLVWTADPFCVIPTPELVQARGLDWLGEFYTQREATIAAAKRDPLRYGHEMVTWKDARDILRESRFLLALGGNGSAKSMLLARLGMEILCPGIECAAHRQNNRLFPRSKTGQAPEALWLSTNETVSITLQNYVYSHIPLEWRPMDGVAKKRSVVSRINFTRSTGFAERRFSLPNSALATFGTYHQEADAFEGMKLDFIGLDENAPLSLVETLFHRLYERDGIMVQGFTPIHGITPAIRDFIAGAKTLRSQRAELLPDDHQVSVYQDWPAGHLPYIQRCVKPRTFVMYMPTSANPASNYAVRAEEYKNAPKQEIESRFYGFARNTVATRLPYFGDAHIIAPEAIPATGTNYQILDLAEARNFCSIWWRVAPDGMNYIYDEWPDVDSMGAWATASDDSKIFDGKPGPAQTARGYSIDDYKRIFLLREGNHVTADEWTMDGTLIEQRIIDSRAGAADKAQLKGGALTVVEMFQEAAPELDYDPASGKDKDEGIQAINNLLRYDPAQRLVIGFNYPRLMVSSRCQNLIWAMRNYTGHDGQKAACGDFIDVLRYGALQKFEHYPPRGRVKLKPKGYGNR